MFEVRCVVDCKNVLGECPVWCPDQQVLWWVDIAKPSLARFDPASGSVQTWPLPKAIGSFALRKNGGFLMAFRSGFATMAGPDAPVEWVEMANTRPPDGRFNDGKCDVAGRFWVGSMDRNLTSPIGELYRLDADYTCTRMDGGFTISNGLGWSPDNRTMYFTDSPPRTIYAYDFDVASGAVENRRVFVEFDAAPGRPDGCTVDAEGFVWSALVNFGRMLRLDPTGNLERIVTFPPTRGTCCTFGGPDYGDLYITTARECLTAEQIAAQPLAGSLFRCRPGVHGLAETPFAG